MILEEGIWNMILEEGIWNMIPEELQALREQCGQDLTWYLRKSCRPGRRPRTLHVQEASEDGRGQLYRRSLTQEITEQRHYGSSAVLVFVSSKSHLVAEGSHVGQVGVLAQHIFQKLQQQLGGSCLLRTVLHGRRRQSKVRCGLHTNRSRGQNINLGFGIQDQFDGPSLSPCPPGLGRAS